MIHRRHVLALVGAAVIAPCRAFAEVAPPRSEIRISLAKYFADAGTEGTFVAYLATTTRSSPATLSGPARASFRPRPLRWRTR
jgi:hypothetical protein